MADVFALIERLEAASGPDRDLDIAIWRAVNPVHAKIVDSWARDGKGDEPPDEWLRAFTSSIDAALTLVPDGWGKSIMGADNGDALAELWTDTANSTARAKTWPLAICIAALKARSASRIEARSDETTEELARPEGLEPDGEAGTP